MKNRIRTLIIGDDDNTINPKYLFLTFLSVFGISFTATYLTSITTLLPVSPLGIIFGAIAGILLGYARIGVLPTWIIVAAAVYPRELHYVAKTGFLASLPSSHLANPGFLIISASVVTIVTTFTYIVGLTINRAYQHW